MAEPARQPAARSGLASVGAEQFSLAQAIGGPRGVIESVGPPVVFIAVFTITQNLTPSLVAALVMAGLAVLARLVTRSAPTQALSGLVGVAICAAVSARTGEARDFFLPGFFITAAYGAACLVSLIPWPRLRVAGRELSRGSYPLLGLFVGPLTGEGLGWRDDPARRRRYVTLTLAWAGFFALRLLVQVPLYLAGQVQALGAAKVAMGVPAFAVMCWFTWLALRARRPAD